MSLEKHTIVVTGGAGYVGEILCAQLTARPEVGKVIVVDRAPQTEFLRQLPALVYIQEDLAEGRWEEQVAPYEPTVIVHAAWQIRASFHDPQAQWRGNVGGAEAVFAFAFSYPSVKKLIHFSTAAAYGAYRTNTLTHYFTEEEGLRDDEYVYAKEKKVAEDTLARYVHDAKKAGHTLPQVTVLRLVAVTGPRGRFLRSRFGLQSALRGDLHATWFERVVSFLTTLLPVTPLWVRQFVHEDDVAALVEKVVTENLSWSYEAFNVTPRGTPVYPKAMAAAVGKRLLTLPPWLVRVAFALFWVASRGAVPTCPHSWRFYAYPILLSGEKLATIYQCQYDATTAITYTDGHYESEIPKEKRRSRTWHSSV